MPTFYNAPGQENIRDESDKIKLPLDDNVADCTLQQLEDVVRGWSLYIRQLIAVGRSSQFADDSPVTEFAKWQKYETEYKVIDEQLQTPFVQSIIGELV